MSTQRSTNIGNNISIEPVAIQDTNTIVNLTFSNVSISGITTISRITNPTNAKMPSSAFVISNSLGSYNITSTASYSGEIRLCFTLPSSVDQATFNKSRIIHQVSDTVSYDATILSGPYAPNFVSKTICCSVTGFSSFYIIPMITDSGPQPSSTIPSTPTPTQSRPNVTPTPTSSRII